MNESSKVKLSHTRRAAGRLFTFANPALRRWNTTGSRRRGSTPWWKEPANWAGPRTGERRFARMTAEVVLGHVGIVLGLEVSRLAQQRRLVSPARSVRHNGYLDRR
jgi:hypothetical protein